MKKCLVRVTNVGVPALRRPLTPAQFGDLAEIPPELEWLANLTNPKTRRAYKIDVEEFIGLDGIAELRSITRAHVIAWRKDLEKRGLAGSSIRRKLSALSALFDYMCEHNAVSGNPVDGVKRQPWPTAMRAARRRWATCRRASCSRRHPPTLSRGPAILATLLYGCPGEDPRSGAAKADVVVRGNDGCANWWCLDTWIPAPSGPTWYKGERGGREQERGPWQIQRTCSSEQECARSMTMQLRRWRCGNALW
jgi:hypothetical protein